jgi:integrase
VADRWFKRHVEANGLRSQREYTRLLERYILPVWKDREFTSIRRSDVTALLDEVVDNHGARQADYVLAIIRGMMNWYATRHDDYTPPIVRGMGLGTDSKQHARDRILSDDELRAVWKAAEVSGIFGAFVRMLLLTAQRRDKVLTMKWTDLSPMKWPSNEPPVWTVRSELREKGNVGAVRLPQVALDILAALPRFADNPYVFAGRTGKWSYIAGRGGHKVRFDARLPKDMPNWRLHDLRRTARSLMSRAGVPREHAERVLGHTIGGVEGVYDRHKYADEKAEALAKLAALIDSIVNPRPNVVSIAKRKAP